MVGTTQSRVPRTGGRSQVVNARDAGAARLAQTTRGSAVAKILQGALVAVGRQGSKKLSIGAICDAANVARGTFYRYFSTKEDVLGALSEFVSQSFVTGIREAAAKSSDPMETLRNVLTFHAKISSEEQQSRIYEVEPEFVMRFLRDHFETHVGAMQDALEPVFAHVEGQRGVRLDRRLIAEALIRLQLSTVLIPGDRHWETIPEALFALFEDLVARAKPRADRSAAGRTLVAR